MADLDLENLRKALAGSPVCLFCLDSEGRCVWVENAQSVWTLHDCIGKHFSNYFDDAETAVLTSAMAAAKNADEPVVLEVRTSQRLDRNLSDRLIKLTIHPAQADGSVLCSALDITQERGYIDMQRVLMMEVSHRSKNMLAMILSLAAQTARSAEDKADFMRRFTGRVQSLARSQDAVTAADWAGVKWTALFQTQVSNIVPHGIADPALTGDDIVLSPNAASHVGLALYELVTWSMTHGALASGCGELNIRLTCVEADDEPAILEWHDTGNVDQECDEPGDNFGKVLLTRIVPEALNGKAILEHRPDGMSYTLTIGRPDFRHL